MTERDKFDMPTGGVQRRGAPGSGPAAASPGRHDPAGHLCLSGIVGSDGFDHNTVAWHLAGPGTHRFVIDSPGGDSTSGRLIGRQLADAGAHVHIRRAGSAAFDAALGGAHRTIAADGWLMAHSCWSVTIGGPVELRAAADRLEQTNLAGITWIVARAGLGRSTAAELVGSMAGRYILAEKALALGLVHEITKPEGIAPPPTPPSAAEAIRSVIGHAALHAWSITDDAHRTNAAAARSIAKPEPRTLDELDVAEQYVGDMGQRFAHCLIALVRQAKRAAELADRGQSVTWPPPGCWRCPDCNTPNFSPPATAAAPTACCCCNSAPQP